MLYCKNCGVEMNENQAICVNCGVKVGVGTTFCHNCGNTLPANAEFCLNCGVGVKKSIGSDNLGGKDKITIALICFFLGGIGIHNFMMGETKKGLFRIFMCFCFGIGYIFALIDFIKILTDKYEVNPEKLV